MIYKSCLIKHNEACKQKPYKFIYKFSVSTRRTFFNKNEQPSNDEAKPPPPETGEVCLFKYRYFETLHTKSLKTAID